MHEANEICWRGVKERYSEYFTEDILEVGSCNVAGSTRVIFEEDCQEYIGVDWRIGKDVDVVTLAHEMKFPKQFKAVISASMLEHDPYWDKSIRQMVKYTRKDGILVLTWGAAHNLPHCLKEAPDGKFHCLKGDFVKNLVQDLGFTITEWVYDCNMYKVLGCAKEEVKGFIGDGTEEICMVAFPVPRNIVQIDESIPDDRI